MIEIFKRDLFGNNILLLIYCFVLRIKSLISPVQYELKDTDGLLNHAIFPWIGSPVIQNIIAVLLVFLHATMINHISNRNQVDHIRSAIPGVMYILLVSYIPGFLHLTPVLIGLTFVILAMINLFDTYKRPKTSAQIFNVGFFISIAGLFYLPFAILFVAGFIGLIIMRSFRISERFQYLAGFCVAIYLVIVFSYYWDFKSSYFQVYIQENMGYVNIFNNLQGDLLNVLIINIILILFALFSYNNYTTKKSIQSQKKIDILYWLLVFSFPTVYFWNQVSIDHFMILAIPLSVFYAMTMMRISNGLLAEMIHLFLVVFIICRQFNLWIF